MVTTHLLCFLPQITQIFAEKTIKEIKICGNPRNLREICTPAEQLQIML